MSQDASSSRAATARSRRSGTPCPGYRKGCIHTARVTAVAHLCGGTGPMRVGAISFGGGCARKVGFLLFSIVTSHASSKIDIGT